MYKIGSMPSSIQIGFVGETNFRTIEIDMTAWMEKMPAGIPSIIHVRPGETKAQAYIAATDFDEETNVLSWPITAGDIGILEGEGEMQVWLEETADEETTKRGKSVKVITVVNDSANEPDATPPEAQAAYMEQMTALKMVTVEAAEDAEDAKTDAEAAQAAAEQAATDAENVNLHPAYIDSTTKHWMVYDATQHQYTDTQILAEGTDATPTLITVPYEDLTFPVSKGTLCYHGLDLCKAKQDISTSEAWTAAHWDVTTVADELRLQMTAIQGLDNDKYEKPSGGIPATDMTQAVQDALADAESAYQKPSGGIPASDIADGVIPVVDSALSYSSENAVQNKVVKGALDTKAPVIINTATGNHAVFNDGGGMPIKSLLIPFTPQQEGTGDPSPQNIRSILPWNGLTVWQAGANLADFTIIQGGIAGATGSENTSYARVKTKDVFFIKGGGTKYTIDAKGVDKVWVYNYNPDGTYASTQDMQGFKSLPYTYTRNGADCGLKLAFCMEDQGQHITPSVISEIRFEVGTTLSPFETADVSEHKAVFPSPVYGGTLDVVSGVLTVTHVCLEVSKQDFTLSGSGAMPYMQTAQAYTIQHKPKSRVDWSKARQTQKMNCAVIANPHSETTFGNYIGVCFWDTNLPTAVRISQDVYDSLQDGDSVSICYEIADPFEIQLTPAQITAIVGDNTIWSDADGKMIVEYPADTALFIANQHRNFIAPELSSMIADTALVENDFRIVGNNLYKITSAIASGGTLTPNTNCVKTTLAEVIKPLLT